MPRAEDFEEQKIQIGRRVAELRLVAELTQAALAARMKASQQFIGNVEQGRQNLTLYTLVRLANALGVRLADLFVRPANGAPAAVGRPPRARREQGIVQAAKRAPRARSAR